MKIGIVGGIGPESTIDYYKGIIKQYQKQIKDGSFPQIVIDSIELKEMIELVDKKQSNKLVDMLVKSIIKEMFK